MILLKNILHQGRNADILVDGSRIAKISSTPLDAPGAQIVDGSGKAVLPSFINMHTHAAMVMLRGIHEDLGLYEWLNHIWAIEAKLDRDFLYWGTKVACLEMLKGGTTTFNDQYWQVPHCCRAAMEMGVRPVISFVFLDGGNEENMLRQREACKSLYQEMQQMEGDFQFAISIHSIYTVREENIRWAADFAREHGLRIHLHLAETQKEFDDCRKAHNGLTPTEYFNSLGVWGPDVIAAHCLFLTPSDIQILGENKVNCVHCVNSNLKLASGYRFYYNELRDAGVNVCIGTDGASSSNNMDILEHMKNSALLQKAWRESPSEMPLQELFKCATENGARALGLQSGAIKEGLLADLMLIDLNNTYFLSPGSVEANLVYAAHSDVITHVMKAGQWVMENRKVPGEEEVLSQARKVLSQI